MKEKRELYKNCIKKCIKEDNDKWKDIEQIQIYWKE